MEDKQLEDALAETIEKSFNDSELEDIMNEIENLEKEFSDDVTPAGPDGLKLEEAKPNDLQDAIDKEVESISGEMESILDEGQAPAAEVEEVLVEEPLVVAEAVEEVETVAEVETVEESDDEVAFSAEEIAAIEESVADMGGEVEVEVEAAAPAEEVTQDDVMDAVMEQIEASETVAEAPEENVVLFERPSELETEQETTTVAETAPSLAPVPGSQIDFNAAGSMDLNINFNVAGQTANLKVENGGLSLHMNGVQLTISEETGCSVKMEGGVQFSIPLDEQSSKKNVA
ncbi:MAG: hypothetical protein BM556_02740 [Bacteriovorax sp. MedPE-SWde]|nr:MAG: hypothetical protein BM556_02740 [Bacteriovorax sp. MedPE-SWde]